jgi:hypothetical protein
MFLPYSRPSMSYGVTLPPGNGAKKICAKLTNSLGSAICGGTITLAAPPSCASMQNAMINTCDAASWTAGDPKCTTSSPNVNFNFVGVTDVTTVSFDLNPPWTPNCSILNTWGSEEAFQSTYAKTLPLVVSPASDGRKICAKLTNNYGVTVCGGLIKYLPPCQVTVSPSPVNLIVGGAFQVLTASVTSGFL